MKRTLATALGDDYSSTSSASSSIISNRNLDHSTNPNPSFSSAPNVSSSVTTSSSSNRNSNDKSSSFSFPRLREHVPGDWPSIVYIKVPHKIFSDLSETADRTLHTLLLSRSTIDEGVKTHTLPSTSPAVKTTAALHTNPIDYLTGSAMVPESNPHISLSRPFALRTHFIDAFVADMRKCLATRKQFVVSVSTAPQDLMILPGDDATSKQYLSCLVEDNGSKALASLIADVDATLSRYGQPTYFKEPIFHISLSCWVALEAHRAELSRLNYKKLSDVFELSICLRHSKPIDSHLVANKSDLSLSPKHLSFSIADKSRHSQSATKSSSLAGDDGDDDDDDDDDDFRKYSVIIADDKTRCAGVNTKVVDSSDINRRTKHKLQVLEIVCVVGNVVYNIDLKL